MGSYFLYKYVDNFKVQQVSKESSRFFSSGGK